MKKRFLRTTLVFAGALLLLATCTLAQEHQWAGRTLDGTEQTIHARLAQLPDHGVFDSINFEVQGKTVVLSGCVMKETVAEKATRAVMRLDGVEKVVNHIEVLPASRRDDRLRQNVYRAIFDGAPAKESAFTNSDIHIIVKNGWVRLEGVANSDADRSDIYRKTMGVTSHVTDNLRVKSAQGAD
jgi:osmotically-inducible protein OsmY